MAVNITRRTDCCVDSPTPHGAHAHEHARSRMTEVPSNPNEQSSGYTTIACDPHRAGYSCTQPQDQGLHVSVQLYHMRPVVPWYTQHRTRYSFRTAVTANTDLSRQP